jgi:DNA-binding PadR family transcriptional regulator
MEPFERFKNLNTEGNLWIYILSLGKEEEICVEDVRRLIFEKFGFLPGNLLVKRVLFRLKNQGYIKSEKFMGKRAFKTTEKGIAELEKMKKFCQELLEKI